MIVPTKTLAAMLFEYGGTDKLVIGEFDLPALGEHDVLVKNIASSVSGWDIKYRSGRLARFSLPGRAGFPLPQQLGREAAGEVVAIGTGVTRFAVGDRVVGVTHVEDLDSLEAARGLGNLSRNVCVPGHQAPGGYARYLVRDEGMWLPLPGSVDFEQASVLLWAFSTAHRVVRNRLGVKPGDDLLVTGASGGMGQATVQLAKLAGARVIVTTRHANKTATLRELGADAVVVTADPDKARVEVLAMTDGQGVDHVVEYTGSRELLLFGKDVLRLGGRFVITTEQGDGPVPFTAADFLRLELNLLGIRGGRRIDMLTVVKLLGEGRIRTRIAARFPLTQVGKAHEMLETSTDLVGRIVLLPWG